MMKKPKIDWKSIHKIGTDDEQELDKETKRLERKQGWKKP